MPIYWNVINLQKQMILEWNFCMQLRIQKLLTSNLGLQTLHFWLQASDFGLPTTTISNNL